MPTSHCCSCSCSFSITDGDTAFYRTMGVPAPLWCPTCRARRRFSWRNERSLFKSRCARSNHDLISTFPPESGIVVFDRDLWWQDDWDALSYGMSYDPAISFFDQFGALLKHVPFPAVFSARCQNTSYCNHVGEMKDCYLTSASWACDRVLYGNQMISLRDCTDGLGLGHCELCYECVGCEGLYNCVYAIDSEGCSDCAFLYDCLGCRSCFGCNNLRHASYCLFNRQCSKAEYAAELANLNLGSYAVLSQQRAQLITRIQSALHRASRQRQCEESIGEHLIECRNCEFCYNLSGRTRDCKYTMMGGMGLNDAYDCYGVGESAELMYESIDSGANGMHYLADLVVWTCTDVAYSINCHNCQNCFGCIGLRGKSHCIFNQQYSAEQYKALRAQIVNHMQHSPYLDRRGRAHTYGDFFPSDLSPFAYNDTLAQDYLPLNEEDALSEGFRWRSYTEKSAKITISADTLPDQLANELSALAHEVIGCAAYAEKRPRCTSAFRLCAAELEFYQRMNLPLPRYCPNCRHERRFGFRRSPWLWQRECSCREGTHPHGPRACTAPMWTSFAPERKERVLCERCYELLIMG